MGEGECRVFMNMQNLSKLAVYLCGALEGWPQSVVEERGRLVESMRQVEGLFESMLSESFGGAQ